MNNLKKQMDQIDIPESLQQRSLQGIEQAKIEQHKPQPWVPKVLTIAVTLAACVFVAFMVGEQHLGNDRASVLRSQLENLSPPMYWILAILCVCIILFSSRKNLKVGTDQKKTIGVAIVLILMIGNSTIFLQHQLIKPIVVPTVIEVTDSLQNALEIRYITNKDDHRYVKYLQAEDVQLPIVYDQTEQTNLVNGFYYPLDTSQDLLYQNIRLAFFQLDLNTMKKVMTSENIYLVLSDGMKLPAPIHFTRETFIDENQIMNHSYSQSQHDSEQIISFTLQQDAVFDAFYVPTSLEDKILLKEWRLNDQRYTVSDFPFSVTAGQRLELMIQFKEDTLDINTSIGFSGPDGYLTKRLYSQAYFTTNLVKKVRENND
ncbi:hypothetical protein [Lysinibacillus boronitolerans]|uniref:hypothetical protein n=1 Tax=Lysinibacillus boronitolerans TaxID=309788 RepID=UPI000A7A8FEE|nr:hypothetical protein [Lysinibacillus boronitolerans]